MKNRSDLYHQLRDLIYSDSNKERECSEFLNQVKPLLFKETLINYNYLETEYRGNVGDSDFIISGTVKLEVGIKMVYAYIWELKAPQCYQFEYDNDNRIKPTKELIQAENQLLWYYHEQKDSGTFRQRFSVSSDCIFLGGIIIGCDQTLVRGKYDDFKKSKLYEQAIIIRQNYFYNPLGIRLMTWNNVLDQFGPEEPIEIVHPIFPIDYKE